MNAACPAARIAYHDWRARYAEALRLLLASERPLTTAEVGALVGRGRRWAMTMLDTFERRGWVSRRTTPPGRLARWTAVPTPAWPIRPC